MSADQPATARLVQVDALRGMAVLAVLLFHYTTQYTAFYPPASLPTLSVPWGHFGVNLFFVISGLVIFMTLERTRRPLDFVVSRGSRLFPVYWVALLLTFAITHGLGLPDRLVDAGTLAANFTMVHGLFSVPHVDSVYWTLEVELLFYAAMFALHRTGRLRQVHHYLRVMLVLRLLYEASLTWLGDAPMPWMLYHLLNIEFLPWFGIGISVYLWLNRADAAERRRALHTAVASVVTLGLVEGPGVGLLALAMAGLVWLAASGRAAWLALAPLLLVGRVSYPLYLVHQYIGFALLLALARQGIGTDTAIALTTAAMLLLSLGLHRLVELPAMRLIRARHRAWQARLADG